MRIRLRPGVHYAQVREGVYVGTPSSHFVIRGPRALYPLLDELVPLLEDGATEDEAAAALRATAAPRLTRQVIAAMRAKRLFLDLSALSEPEPDAGTRLQYAGALADLEAASDDPYAAFRRLRESRVLVAGPPTAVLPAARGLLRAGVSRLLLAVPEPAAARPLAERAPGAAVVALADGKIATEVGEVGAAIYAAPDAGLMDLQRAELRDGCPTVPVLTGGPLAIVGPPVLTTQDAVTWPALCVRARRWQADGHVEPAALPTAEALAGALAGQSLFRLLAGIGRPGEAHVVYGGTLTADALQIVVPPQCHGRSHELEHVEADVAPELDATLDAVHAAARRWLGRYTIVTPEDLPQIPVALVTAEHRVPPGGEVLAWGTDQQHATIAAGLTCLRAQAAPAPHAPAAVGAAGTTRARWLLDGALRLLDDRLTLVNSAAGQDDSDEGAAGRRSLWLRQAIEDYERVRVRVHAYALDGVGWRLSSVTRADTGETVARAWGPDRAQAAVAALAMAIARLQARRALGRDIAARGPDTSALLAASDNAVEALLGQVKAYARRRAVAVTAAAADADQLLGALDLWHGPVHLELAGVRGER